MVDAQGPVHMPADLIRLVILIAFPIIALYLPSRMG